MIMMFVCFFNQCQNAALDELFGNPKEVRLIRYNFIKYLLWHCIRQNHQGWIQSSGLQWNFFFGTPLFKRHKIWSRKSVHKVFVFVTSFEEAPLFRGKGRFFWAPTPRFNLHSGDTLAIKKVTDHSLISSKVTTSHNGDSFQNMN